MNRTVSKLLLIGSGGCFSVALLFGYEAFFDDDRTAECIVFSTFLFITGSILWRLYSRAQQTERAPASQPASTHQNTTRRLGTTLRIAFLWSLVLLVAKTVAFYTWPPDCRVSVRVTDSGPRTLRLKPNFVVNSVSVSMVDATGSNQPLKTVRGKEKEFVLPTNITPGSEIHLICGLQYDRVAPSFTSVRKVVSVPATKLKQSAP